jgi:hypothetical protein
MYWQHFLLAAFDLWDVLLYIYIERGLLLQMFYQHVNIETLVLVVSFIQNLHYMKKDYWS